MTSLPAWQDIATLMHNLCISERTVDAWVKQGLLPPPRMVGGKRLWKWKTVENYLEGTNADAPPSPEQQREDITNATRRAAQTSKDSDRYVRLGREVIHDFRKVSEPR